MTTAALPFTVTQPLLAAVLAHNGTLARAFAAVLPAGCVIRHWHDLTAVLGEDDRLDTLLAGFKGNKSERLVLACVLMCADYAGQADALMPRVFTSWGGIDARNRALVLDMLEAPHDDDDDAATPA
ncbi:hypothetical protein [Caenispirillum bisanense]|uniref:hypothetical protein n=1 Tax=Caenispirillum bisanense TaxID=414052 RepID=UPI0031DC2681